MLPRVLEPEVMETWEDVLSYDAMDHSMVNQCFALDFLAAHGPMRGGQAIDLGTGTARIPIALCLVDPAARVLAVDLSENMLRRAQENIDASGFSGRISTLLADARAIPRPDIGYEAVFSNTILHHIPEPLPVLAQALALLAPGGTLMIRDLYRPASREILDALVATYAGNEPDHARGLFHDSLHAAFTLDEMRGMVESLGIPPETVVMTSDRHWTWTWTWKAP